MVFCQRLELRLRFQVITLPEVFVGNPVLDIGREFCLGMCFEKFRKFRQSFFARKNPTPIVKCLLR